MGLIYLYLNSYQLLTVVFQVISLTAGLNPNFETSVVRKKHAKQVQKFCLCPLLLLLSSTLPFSLPQSFSSAPTT